MSGRLLLRDATAQQHDAARRWLAFAPELHWPVTRDVGDYVLWLSIPSFVKLLARREPVVHVLDELPPPDGWYYTIDGEHVFVPRDALTWRSPRSVGERGQAWINEQVMTPERSSDGLHCRFHARAKLIGRWGTQQTIEQSWAYRPWVKESERERVMAHAISATLVCLRPTFTLDDPNLVADLHTANGSPSHACRVADCGRRGLVRGSPASNLRAW